MGGVVGATTNNGNCTGSWARNVARVGKRDPTAPFLEGGIYKRTFWAQTWEPDQTQPRAASCRGGRGGAKLEGIAHDNTCPALQAFNEADGGGWVVFEITQNHV